MKSYPKTEPLSESYHLRLDHAALIFAYCGAISALPGAFSLVTAVRFSNGQEAFLLTTAAQNIHVFLRESSLHKKHFFEWLETAISSNACGMSTLKSLPSRAFFVSDVHLRPRKHFSRCTLDCGFKTSESPALRGFVGGLRALATAALYLVLKSNGLRHLKNLPAKFDFSPIDAPTNIAKKLPPQRCFKPLLIAVFNFSHKRPTFASQAKVGTHSAFGERSHTAAYTPKQGPSFPRPQRGFALPVKSILFRHAFIYIHFPVLCGPPPSATAPSQTIFHRVFQPLAQMAHVRFHE